MQRLHRPPALSSNTTFSNLLDLDFFLFRSVSHWAHSQLPATYKWLIFFFIKICASLCEKRRKLKRKPYLVLLKQSAQKVSGVYSGLRHILHPSFAEICLAVLFFFVILLMNQLTNKLTWELTQPTVQQDQEVYKMTAVINHQYYLNSRCSATLQDKTLVK